ncbi:MAG TPA: hypothetical protein VFI34_06990 [Candidatus Limnocylindrales bacterium]|nr:hypothetical protein [Candidatus Limnocylindrales bacterium]
MTSSRRFEHELPAALTELATAPYPAYIEDVLRVTSRTRRRPVWQFPRRWIPIEVGPRLRPVVIVGVVVLVILALLITFVGSWQHRLPRPFGPAANGVVAFALDGQGYVATLDGPARPLIDGPGEELGLTFSNDGTKLAFIRLAGATETFWAAAGDGSGQTQLLADPVGEPLSFSWSPDGTEIALSYPIRGVSRIVIVRVDGTGSRILDLDFPAADPTWRPPDGRELLVRRTDRRTGELDVVAPDGSSVRSVGVTGKGLLGGRWDAGGAAWSPDGALIAYHTVDGEAGSERLRVHVVRADGTHDRVMSTSPPVSQEAWPVWSPDGRSIAIQRWTTEGDSRIAVLPLDGGAAPPSIGPRHEFQRDEGWSTIWSPDGTHLLVRWDDTADKERSAYLVDPVTGDFQRVEWSIADHPTWQRVAP